MKQNFETLINLLTVQQIIDMLILQVIQLVYYIASGINKGARLGGLNIYLNHLLSQIGIKMKHI